MIKEIVIKEEWNTILSEVDNYDFYHTYDYHIISSHENETPILLTYTQENTIIALPFVLRPVDTLEYFDLTSVYGYAGPICNVDVETFDFSDFQKAFKGYLQSKKIVSVFSRLHPYIAQDQILESLGNLVSLGDVVNIDLTLPINQSRMAYGKSNKNQINKLRRQCEVIKAETKKDVLEFIDIYYENMKRLDAENHYFFSKDYFLNFMGINDYKTDILLVKHIESNKFIAGSMFVKTKNIVQYHLSGTRTEFLRLKPSKLVLDEMRLQATEQGYKIFNLGGGLGSEHDSLFEFKASFSKDFRAFKIWKYIVNQDIYDKLSEAKDQTKFFPKYRS
jgi:hypothetical protein